MNRKLLPLLLFIVSSLFSSCSFFTSEENDDEERDVPSLTVPNEIIAGDDIYLDGYIPDEYKSNGYDIFFNETRITKTTDQYGRLQIHIGEEMKGEYEVSIRSGNQKDILTQTVVYKFMGDCRPGIAYQADLSDANTIFSVVNREMDGRCTYETKKFNSGEQPVSVKFFNGKGREVYAKFSALKDLSEDFFYAILSNPRTKEEMIFDYKNFTCSLRDDYDTEYPVVVDKNTGYIIFLVDSDETLPGIMNSMNLSFQWMGGRTFCFLPELYGGGLSVNKLFYFEIPEFYYDNTGDKDTAPEEEFAYTATINKVPFQDNLDILNNIDYHWVASSPSNVFFNNERMLRNGSLVSVNMELTDGYPGRQVFCSYSDGGLYYMKWDSKTNETLIYHVEGYYKHTEYNCHCTYDIYQYPEQTYMRAKTKKAGDNIHDIILSGEGNIERREIFVTELENEYSFIRENQYPFYSNYDYFIDETKHALGRRTIAARNEEKIIYEFQGNELSVNRFSSSKNALSFFVLSAGEKATIIEVNTSGNIVQRINVDLKATGQINICRLRD